MGKNSMITVQVTVLLTVTSSLENAVKNNINIETIKENISTQTSNYGKLIKAHNPTTPGGKGFIWHYLEYKFDISLDLYNLVKINSNILVAQAMKLLKNKRKEIVMEKIRKGIEDGFKSNINSGFFNHTAVKFENAKIKEI